MSHLHLPLLNHKSVNSCQNSKNIMFEKIRSVEIHLTCIIPSIVLLMLCAGLTAYTTPTRWRGSPFFATKKKFLKKVDFVEILKLYKRCFLCTSKMQFTTSHHMIHI